MTFRSRALTRAGAGVAGLLAAGTLAAPAFAADNADLEIKVTGTTIAANASGKFAAVHLINHSTVAAKGIDVAIDISKLNLAKVTIDESGCSAPQGSKILCGIEGDSIPAGADIDWFFPISRKAGATGDAGSLTATISHQGADPKPGNNSVTVGVKVGDSGPDLAVNAPDVDQAVVVKDGKIEVKGDLHAGETARLIYAIGNFGDVPVAGFKVSVKLPKGVGFTEAEKECAYAADKTSMVCTYENFPLVPADEDKSDDDKVYSAFRFFNLITVSADAAAPASLTGGTVTVESIVAAPAAKRSSLAVANPPKNGSSVPTTEVDKSDNSDDYSVVVAATGGAGGAAGGGGLPVTGVQASLIGGVGAAVVLAGGAMFLLARRRRVVLVTPGDEKPTA